MARSIGITVPKNASPDMVAALGAAERFVLDQRKSPLQMQSYAVASLPNPADWIDCAIIVPDETGGRTIATSDGTNFRRVKDGAVCS